MGRRGRKKGRRLKPFKLHLRKETVYSVCSTALFIMAGMIMISFAQTGSLLIALNLGLKRYFGWTTIFLPFFCLSFGLLLTRLKIKIGQPNVVLGIVLAIIGLSGLFRSGQIGTYLFQTVALSITKVGAVIIFGGIVFIGL